MNLLHRISDVINIRSHPRFCRDCGKALVLRISSRHQKYDPVTGRPHPVEGWMCCPDALDDWEPPVRGLDEHYAQTCWNGLFKTRPVSAIPKPRESLSHIDTDL